MSGSVKKSKTVILLGFFGSILTLCVMAVEVGIIGLIGDDYGAAAAVLAAVIPVVCHVAVSALVYTRFRKKHGLSAPKFVMLNALPTFIIGTLGYLVFETIRRFNGYGWEGILEVLASLCAIGYSLVYAALLSAVLGIKLAVGRKKERP